jgi:tRNA dimethylallyltransferase
MKLVFVQGLTGAGKSQLALSLAQRFQGAVLNCDSIQCYQLLDIGSAKPSQAERALAPHFLFDEVKPPNVWTVGDYHRAASSTLQKLAQNFKVVFVVGGTGFYFQALEKGLFETAQSNSQLRSVLEKQAQSTQGAELLYNELQSRDPRAAAAISINDKYRLVRFVEILRTTSQTVTELKTVKSNQESQSPYPIMKLGLTFSREVLKPRLQSRIEMMLKHGWVEEVENLCTLGFKEWAPLKSVGYREIMSFIDAGKVKELEDLKESLLTSHLQLAKKQRTWFKRDLSISWVQDVPSREIEQKVESFLNFDAV